jgi:hypothetical protein
MNHCESLKSVVVGVNVAFRPYGTRPLERHRRIIFKAQSIFQLHIESSHIGTTIHIQYFHDILINISGHSSIINKKFWEELIHLLSLHKSFIRSA